jgi:hypothetical protein
MYAVKYLQKVEGHSMILTLTERTAGGFELK